VIAPDQPRTKRCDVAALTTTDTIIELRCHIEILVTRGIVRFVEWAVVSDDVGDIAVLAIAELGIAIARGATSCGVGCRS
jgi:hypothetical protein